MTHECTTTLSGAEVLARAKSFFAERVPQTAAFPDEQGPAYLTLRGQGGEEVAIAVSADGAVTRVRASTLFFDQAVARFLTTLPAVGVPA
ncbi:MAG: hypothetical protein ACREL4_04675 [Gemmatimonadales bacterium]